MAAQGQGVVEGQAAHPPTHAHTNPLTHVYKHAHHEQPTPNEHPRTYHTPLISSDPALCDIYRRERHSTKRECSLVEDWRLGLFSQREDDAFAPRQIAYATKMIRATGYNGGHSSAHHKSLILCPTLLLLLLLCTCRREQHSTKREWALVEDWRLGLISQRGGDTLAPS